MQGQYLARSYKEVPADRGSLLRHLQHLRGRDDRSFEQEDQRRFDRYLVAKAPTLTRG